MAHAQQQLLDTLQALLAAGGTVAGSRVFVDRVDPLQPSELPAIVLTELGEGVEPFTISSIDRRSLSVQVHCVLSHSTTAQAEARAFGLAVEKLIASHLPLAALASQGVSLTSSRPSADGDTDRLLAARVQAWELSYLARSETPDLIL